MATSTKTSLEAIPLLKGRQNYTSWAKQMESHLKASNAWEILSGRWEKPTEPLYFKAPIRPQNLIDDHRARRLQDEQARADDDEATPLPPYVPLSLKDAEKELGYIKTHIEQWDEWKKTERTAINDINSRISNTCKEELGSLDDLKSIWDRLKVLYVESTCGTWVKELNTLFKLKGGRKAGENPDEWMRKVVTTTRSIRDNLGEINLDILAGYLLTVDLGDDITTTTTETYRQSEWPSVDSIRTSISEEYQSKLNAGKTKPTASARPDNEDPKLNLTIPSSTGRKRSGTRLSSSHKKQDTHSDEEKKGRPEWPKCPTCDTRHLIRKKGECFLARPETAPAAWRERNQDRIETFKKKSQ
jgi:hypothetical protein